MNSLNLIGRLVADPEVRHTAGGTEVSNFRIAVQRDKEVADFIPCTAYGKTAENINRYFHKGEMIGISGSIRIDQWKNEMGENRSKTYCSVSRFDFVGSRKNDESYDDRPIFTQVDEDDDFPF